MILNNMENRNNHQPRVHYINNKNGSLVFTLWKWGETGSSTSLLLIRTIATSGYWIFPYSIVVVVVFAQMWCDSGINPFSLQHGLIIVLVMSPDS